MSPVVSASLAVLAVVLAIAALVLATVANRRWVAGGTRSRRDPMHATDSQPAALADETAQLGHWSDGAQAAQTDLRDDTAELSARVAGLTRQVEELQALEQAHATLAAEPATEPATEPPADPTALRHVALVRYDAFADVGGRLSYSVALLDDTGSGLVLTTLAGKADVRTYVRAVSGGQTDGTLTAEEQQAIEAALGRL